MSRAVLLTPLLLQGISMLVDDLYFHRKRGLGRWERIGHPVDTLSVLACWSIVAMLDPSSSNVWVFIVLSALSCLLVTKDEWVHARESLPGEQWLHAVLFLLHPLCFFVAWKVWVTQDPDLLPIARMELFLITTFLLYQIFYWNFLWKPKV